MEANGLRFEVLVCEPAPSTTDATSSPPLAICLHGFPEVAESWLPQIKLLSAMGYRVWAPNQRGYGRSSRPARMRDYAIELLVEDAACLIDAAVADTPGAAQRVVLLGHDWGGIVAWVFATRRARLLERLVIVNVPHPVPYLRSLRGGRQMVRSWYVAAFQLPWLPERWLGREGARRIPEAMRDSSAAPERFPQELLDATRENAAQPGALKAMIDWYRAFVRGGGLRRQLRLGFPVIEIPTLLLWGEQDAFLGKETTVGTDAFVRELTLCSLPEVSHWVGQDGREAFAAALRRFLNPGLVPPLYEEP